MKYISCAPISMESTNLARWLVLCQNVKPLLLEISRAYRRNSMGNNNTYASLKKAVTIMVEWNFKGIVPCDKSSMRYSRTDFF